MVNFDTYTTGIFQNSVAIQHLRTCPTGIQGAMEGDIFNTDELKDMTY